MSAHDHHSQTDSTEDTATFTSTPSGRTRAHERFGGLNWGASFFGWLVAIAVAVLLTSIIGAVATAISSSMEVTQSEAEQQAGTIGIVAASVLALVLAVGYYAGGYVASRMSRFDGGRQGLGVWLIGLLVSLVAIGLGAVFGNEYDLLDRVDLPNIPLGNDELGVGAIITAIAVLLLTCLAALFGGKVGQRYNRRVDALATD